MTKLRIPRKICSRIGLALFVSMLVWIFGMVVMTVVSIFTVPELFNTEWFFWILNDAPLYLLGMPVFLLILLTIPDGVKTESTPPPFRRPHFGLGKYILVLVFCIGATYSISYLSNFFIEIVNLFKPVSLYDSADSFIESTGLLPGFLFGVCVPAVGEEFIFRYMLRRKMRGCGDKIYILFSALCFAIFHANVAQIFFAFAVGAAFAWAYLQTDRIWVPISLHFCINLIGMIIVPLVSGSVIATVIFGAVILVLIATAIALFALNIRRINRQMSPPAEGGWPYAPPSPPVQWVQPSAQALPAAPAPYSVQYTTRKYTDNYYNQYYTTNYLVMQSFYYYKLPKARSICLGNVGMILYMSLAGLLTLVTLLA